MNTIGQIALNQARSMVATDSVDDTSFFAEQRKKERGFDFTPSQEQYIAEMFNGIRRGATFVLCGTRGTGKSEMAKEVRERLFELRDTRGLRYLAQNVFEKCGVLYHNNCNPRFINEPVKFRDRIAGCSLLVLDEIHDIVSMKVGGRLIRDVVVRRHEGKLPTILITNMPSTKLGLDSTILDRVNDGGCVFEPTWTSFRGREAA